MTDQIRKFIDSLDLKVRKKLKQRLMLLKSSPFRARDVKKMQTSSGEFYRLRMGKIRIVYRMAESEIEIIDIDYRGNIY